MNTFFNSSAFAVVGASSNRSKFGNKVLRWYQSHDLPATPINPKETMIEGATVVKDLEALPSPHTISISIITPPAITLDVIKTALSLDVPAIWLQPGCEDESVVSLIQSSGKADRFIFGGPCILVIGERLIAEQRSRL